MNATTETAVQLIPIALIAPDPSQPRKEFTPEKIEALGESILAEGLLQPITVRPDPDRSGHYFIVAGECRWRAHCLKAIQQVRAIVVSGYEDGRKRFRAQIMENMGRNDMSLKETAFALQRLSDMGENDAEIGRAVCMGPKRVENIRKLTQLSATMWALIEGGGVPPKFAEQLMGRGFSSQDTERFLLHAARYGIRATYVAMVQFEQEIAQNKFDFSLDEATQAIAAERDFIANGLATLLIAIRGKVRGMTMKQRVLLYSSIGEELSKVLPAGCEMKHEIDFLWRVGNHAVSRAKEGIANVTEET